MLMADTCGLNVVIPLTADRIVLREQGLKPNYKSTGFPGERDYPLVCTWNVKVYAMKMPAICQTLHVNQFFLIF